ncbi:MAG: hypothetical protein VX265_03900 [Myxococcota bacterium]|nr:hypothetical protein [Myxococcota bacterium]
MRSAILGALLAVAPAAHAASQAEEAERDRIVEEMKVLAARQQWKGVEQLYSRLLPLEKHGVVVAAEHHMLAVESARSSGDIDAVLDRLERAVQAGAPDAAAQREDVLSRFGRVQLELSARPADPWSLEQVPAPFAPVARAAIRHADAALHERRRFTGFLPAGTYQIGEARFQVDAGRTESLITIAGEGEARQNPTDPGTKSRPGSTQAAPKTGLRTRAGLGLGGATAPAMGVLAPPSSAGLAPVLGAGLAWRSGALHLSGLFVGRALMGTAGAGGQQLYLGTAELLLGWDLGAVRLEAGPLYGVGAGRSVGVAATADPTACVRNACEEERVRGTSMGAGGEVGVVVPLFRTGPAQGGLDLHAGAMGDGTRLLPWMTVALGFTPEVRQ